MRLKNLSLFLTSSVIVLTAISLGTTVMYYNFSQARKNSSQSLVIAIRACERLREGSDILTSAVRAYAATGEERYRSAFQMELLQTRSRDQAMAELRTLGLRPDELERFESAKRNSDALVVEVENFIFDAAARKDFRTALSLAYGERYQRFKDSIMVPTRTAQTDLETRLTAEGTRYSEMADQVRIVVFFAYALNLIAVVAGLGWYIQRQVITPLAALTGKTQRLLAGDKGVDFRPQADQTEIGDLARALEDFRKAEAEMERQRWIKNGLMAIVAGAQEADNLHDFARQVLQQLAPLVDAGAGAMFYRDEKTGDLVFLGGYGIGDDRSQDFVPPVAGGLLTEALDQGRMLRVRKVPGEHLRIVSGLGESAPRLLVLVPILGSEHSAAVVELACLADPDDQQWGLLEELPAVIAPHLELVLRARRAHRAAGRHPDPGARAGEEGCRTARGQQAAPGERGQAGARRRRRGGGQQGQERLPGQHEPRDPHAHERGAGLHPTAPARPRPGGPAAGIRGHHQPERPPPAGPDQRRARDVEDRGGAHPAGTQGFRFPPHALGPGLHVPGAHGRKGHRLFAGDPGRRAALPGHRPHEGHAGARQRHRQRPEVHRARRDHGPGERHGGALRRTGDHGRGPRHRHRHRRNRTWPGSSTPSSRPRPASTRAAPAWAWPSAGSTPPARRGLDRGKPGRRRLHLPFHLPARPGGRRRPRPPARAARDPGPRPGLPGAAPAGRGRHRPEPRHDPAPAGAPGVSSRRKRPTGRNAWTGSKPCART